MMIKCPNCGKEIDLAQQDDMEPTLWNFDGSSGEVEVVLYCEDCDEVFKAEIGYNMWKIRVHTRDCQMGFYLTPIFKTKEEAVVYATRTDVAWRFNAYCTYEQIKR